MPEATRVEHHPLTVADLNDAVTYYNDRQRGLGDRLRHEVYAAIERVRTRAPQFPDIESGIRRCLVHNFPYSILFRIIDPTTVRILVIRHHRRHPHFGLRRR